MELFILGFLAGLATAPMLRSWVIWREHRAASRAAWLAEETLRRLEDQYAEESASSLGDRPTP
jgi:hypothetical protein